MKLFTIFLFVFAFLSLIFGSVSINNIFFSWEGPLQQHFSYRSSSSDHFFLPYGGGGEMEVPSNRDVIFHIFTEKHHSDLAPTLISNILLVFSGVLLFVACFYLGFRNAYVTSSILSTIVVSLFILAVFFLYIGGVDCTKGRTFGCFKQILGLLYLTVFTASFVIFSIFLQKFIFKNISEERGGKIKFIKKMFTTRVSLLVLVAAIAPLFIALVTN